MNRMSAKFVGRKICETTAWVYEVWSNMGLVCKDKLGDWTLTELGKQIGGRMSESNYLPVPTFEFEKIEKMMREFLKKK